MQREHVAGGASPPWLWLLLGWLCIALVAPSLTRGQEQGRGGGAALKAGPAQAPHLYPNVYALAVGINQYRSQGIPALKWAEKDAEDVATLFEERYGYQVTKIIGAAATKAAILAKLQEYQDRLGPDDALLLFFAGHGQTVAQESHGRGGYLVPYDALLQLDETSDRGRWAEQAIDMRDLAERAQALRARHVLLLVDVCFSGFLGKRSGSAVPGRVDLQELLLARSRMVITAGTADQKAFEDETLQHGIFTHALLTELKKEVAASASEVFVSLRMGVARQAGKAPDGRARMLPQLRELVIDNGEFVFVPKSVPNVWTALTEIGKRMLAARGSQTTLAQLLAVSEAHDYRYAVDAPQQERQWQQKLARFQDNASLGDPLAMAALHYCYTKGLGTKPNPAEALKWAHEAYATEQAAGKHVLAVSYANGLGVEKNPHVAAQLYTQAAQEGFAPAQYQRAVDLLRNNPTVEQVRDAVELLHQAMAAGLLQAPTQLANLYEGRSPGIPQDMPQALQLLRPAAEGGFPEAQFTLSQISNTVAPGYPPRDVEQARHWLVRAAEAGHARAQFTLAGAYYQKPPVANVALPNVPQDFVKAHEWAQLAAAQNLPQAHLLLAFIYKAGDGVGINYALARQHCNAAVKANYSAAITQQGVWYLEGLVYPHHPPHAEELFTQAAHMGDMEGQYRLGHMLTYEREFPRVDSWYHGLHWYIQAAKQGHLEAKKQLQEFQNVLEEQRKEEFYPPKPPQSSTEEPIKLWKRWGRPERGSGGSTLPIRAEEVLQRLRRAYPESAADLARIVGSPPLVVETSVSSNPKISYKLYSGSIVSVRYCTLDEGDRRVCYDMEIRLSNGEIFRESFYAGVEIYIKGGIMWDEQMMANAPSSIELDTRLAKIVSNQLTPGKFAEITVSCSADGCVISRIKII